MPDPSGSTLRVFSGIDIKVIGVGPNDQGFVSTKGRFIDQDTYQITHTHFHFGRIRDVASYIGLACVLFVWGRDFWGRRACR